MTPSRRVFMGSAAAIGVGAVAGGGTLLLETTTSAQTPVVPDLVEDEIRRQVRDSVHGLRGARRGEAARKLASAVRMAAAHFRAKGLDVTVRRQLQAQTRRDGRDAFLRRELDPQRLAAELREFGITTPLPPLAIDIRARARMLDDMLANGISNKLESTAAAIERLATLLDDRPIVPINLRQQCPDVSGYVLFVEMAMASLCFFNIAACAIFTGMYAGLRISLWAIGCPA
jgi:hypothetical protein